MAKTLLQMGQEIARSVKAPRPVPSSIAGSEGAETLFQALNDSGQYLMKQWDWSILHREESFELQDGVDTYQLPADFDRLIPNTGWDETNLRMMSGSQSPQRWQWAQNVTVTLSQFRRWYRINVSSSNGGTIRFYPPPEVSDPPGPTVVFEYISRNWAKDSMGNAKASMSSDSDEPILDDFLVRLGGRWMFKVSESLAYLDDRNDWERMVQDVAAGDAPPPIAFSNRDAVWRRGCWDWRGAWPCNVPDGGYGM